MTIHGVLFDAAGTLMKTAMPVGETYADIAKGYGRDISPADLSARFRGTFERAAPLAFPGAGTEAIGALERSWWKQLVREIFAPFGPFDDFDAYFDDLFAYFARPESWTLYPETIETLRALRERGLELAVVSNFDTRLLGILDGLGAASWFHGIFVSSTVGYAKPDRRIFDFVLKAHGLLPEHVLHVGDSMDKDVVGAANAGLRAILVDRKGSHEPSQAQRVRNLKEILTQLD